MGSPLASFAWREVVGKRWMRCGVWQAAISSIVFLVWEFVLKLCFRRGDGGYESPILAALWTCLRFVLFQTSQMFFLLGQTFISEPGESEMASMGDLAAEFWKRVWRAALGVRGEEFMAKDAFEMRMKVRARLDYIVFTILCVFSGFLGFISLLSSPLSSMGISCLDMGLRGVTLGFVYAALQSYQKKIGLSVPIIQRRFYFSFKMGIPPAVNTSCLLALALLPFGETVSQIFAFERGVKSDSESLTSAFWWQPWFVAGAFVISLCWEVGHHLVQVFHTTLHEFAPPLGSPSAEKNSTDLLLMILEEPPEETGSLVQYHAFLDLCNVSETNVDTWRRAAIFEETGDTYRRLINLCLKRLDGLTAILAQGLEGTEADKGIDSLRRQIESLDGDYRRLISQQGDLSSSSQDFQVSALCARTVASLTSSSRSEDKYGVAQLHCCNAAVISSLLSCLLVLEVYLGRRSSASGVTFSQKSVNWTVPGRGAFVEKDKRKNNPFGKRTILHKKAYALGDVLRTCLYQIVYAFSEEMVVVGSGGKGNLLAVKDWVSEKKPVYGTQDMHIQKLIAFLPYQVG
ncbi:unnamed protein product [Calypogeia fissa]